jgi:phosphohistidine phosphatase
MKILLIRHAIAVPHGTPGFSDDERPLTPKGEKRFRKAARGLAAIVDRPQALLSSPLTRALQTAEIAAVTWGEVEVTVEPAFAHSNIDEQLDAFTGYPADALVAAVGHEPHMSALLARLIGGGEQERLEFRKGGAAMVKVTGAPHDGGRLVWYIRPRILRALAKL